MPTHNAVPKPCQACTRRFAACLMMAAWLLGAAHAAHADQALWELGLGLGTLSVSHYRGSDQNHHWVLPVPYVVYRGDIFRSDREGTRAVLLDTERVDLDLSLGGTPPARSRDNRARTGMPDLAATLEIGPKLNLRLGQGAGWKLDLRLPLRAAIAAEDHPKFVGWTLSPVLNLDVQWQGWNLGLQGGPMAAGRAYNAYFYDVTATQATPVRSAYAARSGYAGWGATTAATRRVGNWWLAGFWRYDSVAGATLARSPLVTQRSNQTFGVALSWVFKVSDARVPERP